MSAPNENATDGGFLRVSAGKISKLMDLVGELSLGVSETVGSPDLKGLELPHFETAAHRLGMIVREVQSAATELRLVAVDDVFRRLRRMVRELERQTGKTMELVVEGEDTAIDKLVADRLYDPLLHVLRNAADHGLETPEQRRAAGKPEAGRITLSATQAGRDVRIVVADDGRGLNRAKILARARERGLFGAEEEPEDGVLWRVIFEPGFSTAEQVSNLSGRGVGMDVLNDAMKSLRGRILVESEEGRGASVTLVIPTSLAFLDCIILRLADRLFAVPIDAVSEIVQPASGDLMRISAEGSREMLNLRGMMVPVLRLHQVYGEASPPSSEAGGVLIVLHAGAGLVGVPVDEVLDRQQVVMKPLSGLLSHVRASFGCALLGTGEVALVLDCDGLVRREDHERK